MAYSVRQDYLSSQSGVVAPNKDNDLKLVDFFAPLKKIFST